MQPLAKEQKSTILLLTDDRRIIDVADRIVSMEDGSLVRKKVGTLTVISN